jgi:hypothetical protein
MDGVRMRIATGSIVFLTMAAHPALSSEAFIAQLTSKAVATEQAAGTALKTALSVEMLALPLQPKAANSAGATAAVSVANTSTVAQFGTNNFAAVSQTGGGSASAIVQHGSGNQVMVMQRH